MFIMEIRHIFGICLLYGLSSNVYGAKIYIGQSPQTVRFGTTEGLRLSEIVDVIAGSLGYTTVSTWPGLNIASPFGYPLSFILVNVISDGHDVHMEGKMYNVKQETSVNSVYNFVQNKLKTQSERSLSFQNISPSDLMAELKQSSITNPTHLDQAVAEDDTFIHEMEVLPSIIDQIEKLSSVGHGGQDVTFVQVESFNRLIAKYGSNSSQVKEADYILKRSLSALEERVSTFYGGRTVFASLFTEDVHHISKRATTFTDSKEDLVDINLVSPYSEDFPIVFNIVLFLSIVLTLAVVASSASMAMMDPGHDSIIYRMTNPRMKKD